VRVNYFIIGFLMKLVPELVVE